MSDGDKENRQARFRRPDWQGPAEDGGENLPAVDVSRTGGEIGRALEPMRDLARAFQQNSEVLKALADGQARLARRLERSDRSEAVIQSTKALNDTFRGVQRTQEKLMGRLKDERRRPFLLLVLVLLLVGGLVSGTIWYLTSWADRREEKARVGERRDWRGVLADRQAKIDSLEGRIATLTKNLAAERSDADAARGQVEDLTKKLDDLSKQNAALKDAQAGLTRLARENAVLGAEKRSLQATENDLRAKIESLTAELSDREAKIANLKKKLEDLARRLAAGGSSPAASASTSPARVKPIPEPPKEATTDKADLTRIKSVLNGLLLDSSSSESYRFQKVGGVRGRILYDVVVVNLDKDGREAKRIEAAKCRIVINQAQRRAEIRFRNGHLVYYGMKAPFWGDTYVVPLVDIDPQAWLSSGLTIFEQAH